MIQVCFNTVWSGVMLATFAWHHSRRCWNLLFHAISSAVRRSTRIGPWTDPFSVVYGRSDEADHDERSAPAYSIYTIPARDRERDGQTDRHVTIAIPAPA